MSDWCPTRAGCCSLLRPADAERCKTRTSSRPCDSWAIRTLLARRGAAARASRSCLRLSNKPTIRRLRQLRSCGTLERWGDPNDKTTLRRRCWGRLLGLRQCHRPMRRLPRGSRSQPTFRGLSGTLTTPNLRCCSRPLSSRSIVAIKPLPRTNPLRWLRRSGRHHKANP
jgi:hypothetical protein